MDIGRKDAWFGQEVLHDDFLHVTVTPMRVGDGDEGFDAIGTRFADADQDAGGERDLQFAGDLESGESTLGGLVGRTTMTGQIV